MKSIKVYGKPTCPWCNKVKQFLNEKNIEYQDLDISQDEAARAEMVNKTSQLAVPVVDIDGELAVGFDENWIKQKLGIS